MNGPHCIEAQLCRADFYYKLTNALKACSGRSDPKFIESIQNAKFSDVVDLLAQNGIRMIYSPEWSIEKYET